MVGTVGHIVAYSLQDLINRLRRADVIISQFLLNDDSDAFQSLDSFQRIAHNLGEHLPKHNHRFLSAEEISSYFADPCNVGYCTMQDGAAFVGKLQNPVVEQGLADGYIDVYRTAAVYRTGVQSLVDQSVAVPAFFVVMWLRQCDTLADVGGQGVLLVDCLPVLLVNPLHRSVG